MDRSAIDDGLLDDELLDNALEAGSVEPPAEISTTVALRLSPRPCRLPVASPASVEI